MRAVGCLEGAERGVTVERRLDQERVLQISLDGTKSPLAMHATLVTSVLGRRRIEEARLVGVPRTIEKTQLRAAQKLLRTARFTMSPSGIVCHPRLRGGGSDSDDGVTSYEGMEEVLDINEQTFQSPDDAQFHLEYGELCEKREYFPIALRSFRIAAGLNENNPDLREQGWIYQCLGWGFQRLGELAAALDCHEKGATLALMFDNQEGAGRGQRSMGDILLEQGKTVEALGYYEQALQTFGNLCGGEERWELYHKLALGYLSLEDLPAAKRAGDELLRLPAPNEESRAEAFFQVALVYHEMGDYQKSISLFEETVRVAEKANLPLVRGRGCGGLGTNYEKLGDYTRAIELHHQHLASAVECSDRAEEGSAYGNLGSVYQSLGKFSKAMEFHRKRLRIAQEAHYLKGEAIAYSSLGNAYSGAGLHTLAVEHHEQALAIALEHEKQLALRIYPNLGICFRMLGKKQRALECYEQGLQYAAESNDRAAELGIFLNCANLYDDLGDYEKSLEWGRKGLELAHDLRNPTGEWLARNNLAAALRHLGRFVEAEEEARSAIRVAAQQEGSLVSDSWRISIFEQQYLPYHNLRDILVALGRPEEALGVASHGRSRALVKLLGKKQGTAPPDRPLSIQEIQDLASRLETTLVFYSETFDTDAVHAWVVPPEGQWHFSTLDVKRLASEGEMSQALSALAPFSISSSQRQENLRSLSDGLQEGLEGLADILRDEEAAEPSNSNTLELSGPPLSTPEEGFALASRARLNEDWDTMVSVGGRLLEMAEDWEGEEWDVRVNLLLTEGHNGQSDGASGLMYAEVALALARGCQDQVREIQALIEMGRSHRLMSRSNFAIQCTLDGVKLAIEGGHSAERMRASLLLGQIYEEGGDRNIAKSFDAYGTTYALADELKEPLAIAKAREGLERLIETSTSEIAPDKLRDILIRFSEADSIDGQWDRLLKFGTKLGIISLKSDDTQSYAYANLFVIRAHNGLNNPAKVLSRFQNPPKWTTPEFEVELAVEKGIAHLLLKEEGEAKEALAAAYELSRQIGGVSAKLYRALALYQTLFPHSRARDSEPAFPTADEALESALHLAQSPFERYEVLQASIDLYRSQKNYPRVIALVKEAVSASRALMRSTRALVELRQEAVLALKNQMEDSLRLAYQVLIDPVEHHLAPNGRLTLLLDAHLQTLPFAIFRDDNDRYLVEKHPISFAPSLEVLQQMSQAASTRPPNKGALVVGNPGSNLPESRHESIKVGELLGEAPIFGEEANLECLRRQSGDVRYLHLSCHGNASKRSNESSLFQGALRLADGWWHATDVRKSSLKAELAFLSACNSGRGNLQKEGVIGLTRAFLAAGVPSVVTTHWSLPDNSKVVEMIEDFYRRLLITRADKPEALQQAMLSLLDKYPELRSQPHKWGAFFLFGLS